LYNTQFYRTKRYTCQCLWENNGKSSFIILVISCSHFLLLYFCC